MAKLRAASKDVGMSDRVDKLVQIVLSRAALTGSAYTLARISALGHVETLNIPREVVRNEDDLEQMGELLLKASNFGSVLVIRPETLHYNNGNGHIEYAAWFRLDTDSALGQPRWRRVRVFNPLLPDQVKALGSQEALLDKAEDLLSHLLEQQLASGQGGASLENELSMSIPVEASVGSDDSISVTFSPREQDEKDTV